MAMAIALRSRINNNSSSCRFIKFFSSSGPKTQDEEATENAHYSSVVDSIRSKLHQTQPKSPVSNNKDIASTLSVFRPKTAPLPPKEADPFVSLEKIYKRNLVPEGPGSSRRGGVLDCDKIPELGQNKQNPTPAATAKFSEFLGNRSSDPKNQQQFLGGENRKSTFGKELGEAEKDRFVNYKPKDLGEKLKKMRPEETKGNNRSFSLQELNERLMKLREIDRIRSPNSLTHVDILRHGISKMFDKDADMPTISRAISVHKDFLTPNYMKKPPKEDLVERYFHPDNMSSAEKMKLELQKVRDEFKMSETDCGSSRVQVATLTTRIKHLSASLHKKDKHSRKGLLAMVQKRKKLLKYMRRTDWDSYCLVLSKLGLRDNPDYKS